MGRFFEKKELRTFIFDYFLSNSVDSLQFVSFKKCELFDKVISKGIFKTKSSLIIGTYNLQDIRLGNKWTSLSEFLINKLKRGVKVLICLSPIMKRSRFIKIFRKKPWVKDKIFIRFCRRMHFKTIIVDLKYAYIGSANLSGAGVGLKSQRRRNFELGFVTRDSDVIADIADTFMDVFNGKYCSKENCHFYKNNQIRESCQGIKFDKI